MDPCWLSRWGWIYGQVSSGRSEGGSLRAGIFGVHPFIAGDRRTPPDSGTLYEKISFWGAGIPIVVDDDFVHQWARQSA